MVRCTARCTLLFTGILLTTLSAQAETAENLAPQTAIGVEETEARKGVWPPDCTRDIPLDGLVLIDNAAFGSTENVVITLQPGEGAAVPGSVDAAHSTAARTAWRSEQPLLANTEYKLTVTRAGEQLWLGHFTTGSTVQQPLSFVGAPAARVLPHPSESTLALVRIALPGLSGGLPHLPVQLNAALVGNAAEQQLAANVSDSTEVAPRQPISFELEVALGETAESRCVTIGAVPQLGAAIALDPEFCVQIPARAGAAKPAVEVQAQAALTSTSAEEAVDVSAHDSGLTQLEGSEGAGGCSVGAAAPLANASWLAVALLPLVARRRSKRD